MVEKPTIKQVENCTSCYYFQFSCTSSPCRCKKTELCGKFETFATIICPEWQPQLTKWIPIIEVTESDEILLKQVQVEAEPEQCQSKRKNASLRDIGHHISMN